MDPLVTPEELAKVIGLPATDAGVMNAAQASNELVTQYLVPLDSAGQPIDHSTHPKDREAALNIAVSVFQARTAAGGQVVGMDYTPLPFRMGRNLMDTVGGLLSNCLDQGSEMA